MFGRLFSFAIGICSYNFYSFYRAFHDTSFEKKNKILSFVCPEIFAKQTMLQTFWDTWYFMVFNILTITLSFLNEIQNLFLPK